MFIAVGAGAFGAHGLRDYFAENPRLEANFDTAVRYQIAHALGLLAIAAAASYWDDPLLGWAGWLFVAGIIIFSGSLYLLSLTGVRWLGAITPFGGIAFLAGWASLFVAAWRN